MKFFARVLLETVFLLQGTWDLFQALEVFLLISDLGNYAVQYLANNFIILILRIGIWQSRFKRIDALVVSMAVGWVIVKIISSYMHINVQACTEPRDQTYIMIVYHSIGFACGVFSLIIDLCHTNKVTATVWANTLGFKDCQIDTKTGITKKSTETPKNSIDMEFTDSSIEDVAEFVRRRLYSEQSIEVKTVKKLASVTLNMRPMRFNI